MGLSGEISGIRLSERERSALGKAMGIHTGNERRRHRRHMLPKEFTLVVRLEQPGGGGSLFSVTPRDMSISGLGFYHASYIHPSTACTLMMRTLKGDAISLPATVMRCRHVSGRIHEVGVLFEHEIDVEMYVAEGQRRKAENASPQERKLPHARLLRLTAELKQMVEFHAAPTELMAMLGELALLVSPFEHPEPTLNEPPPGERPPPPPIPRIPVYR